MIAHGIFRPASQQSVPSATFNSALLSGATNGVDSSGPGAYRPIGKGCRFTCPPRKYTATFSASTPDNGYLVSSLLSGATNGILNTEIVGRYLRSVSLIDSYCPSTPVNPGVVPVVGGSSGAGGTTSTVFGRSFYDQTDETPVMEEEEEIERETLLPPDESLSDRIITESGMSSQELVAIAVISLLILAVLLIAMRKKGD